MATPLPTKKEAMVRMTRRMMSTRTQVFYRTLLMYSKLASEFVDSGSRVSLISWNFFQLLEISGALEVNKGRSLKTNSTSVPANGKAVFIFLREKFVTEFRAVFLMSTIDTLPCLLGLDFLTGNDCILYAR